MPELLMRLAALAAVLALGVTGILVTPAGAVTVAWHTVQPCAKGTQRCPWFAKESEFTPRPEARGGLARLEADLAATLYGKAAETAGAEGRSTAAGQLPDTSLPHYGWESSDGWWCDFGEVHAPDGVIYNLPNPHGIPGGWWGSPACRSMTIGPEGAHWFTDPGSESVGCVCNGTVSEYPLPQLPKAAQGYEGDPWPTPAAITAAGSELWVASSSGEGMFSVNPSATAKSAARNLHRERSPQHHLHRRRRHQR
jgi:hypothetical protein